MDPVKAESPQILRLLLLPPTHLQNEGGVAPRHLPPTRFALPQLPSLPRVTFSLLTALNQRGFLEPRMRKSNRVPVSGQILEANWPLVAYGQTPMGKDSNPVSLLLQAKDVAGMGGGGWQWWNQGR